MDRITRQELLGLWDSQGWPRVSAYVPMARARPESLENAPRLKCALDEAERRLIAGGTDKSEARALLADARAIASPGGSVPDGGPTLAVFVEPGRVRVFDLPYACRESLDVGDRYHLTPLARSLQWPVEFLLLTLSGRAARLMRATRLEMELIELPASTPPSFRESIAGVEAEDAARIPLGTVHGQSGPPLAVVRSGVSPKDELHLRQHEYVEAVARGVASMKRLESLPLVVAAVEETQAVFRRAYAGKNLFEPGVLGSPDSRPDHQLRDEAVALLEGTPHASHRASVEAIRRAEETHRARFDLCEIALLAHQGRVDTLLVADGLRAWGTWDAAAQSAWERTEGARSANDVDLADFAVGRTLQQGGHVDVLPAEQVPGGNRVAAALRW